MHFLIRLPLIIVAGLCAWLMVLAIGWYFAFSWPFEDYGDVAAASDLWGGLFAASGISMLVPSARIGENIMMGSPYAPEPMSCVLYGWLIGWVIGLVFGGHPTAFEALGLSPGTGVFAGVACATSQGIINAYHLYRIQPGMSKAFEKMRKI